MNRNVKLDQCGICLGDLSYLLFFAKREISFEVSTFGGSLFIYLFIFFWGGGGGGNRYFRDLLTPVTFYRYFRRFATFDGRWVATFGTLQ